jgi:hypothetical protein
MLNLMFVFQDATAPAAEAATEAAASGWTLDGILKLVLPLIGLALTAFAIPWLRKMGAKADAESKKTGLEAGSTLVERVKSYVFRRVADLIEDEYPKIAAEVITNGLSTEAIKERLYGIGAGLKQEAIEYFQGQGIDLVKEMGDKALDSLIRSAANQLSPFPGKSTAVVLAESTVSNLIVDKGVDWAAKKFLSE